MYKLNIHFLKEALCMKQTHYIIIRSSGPELNLYSQLFRMISNPKMLEYPSD